MLSQARSGLQQAAQPHAVASYSARPFPDALITRTECRTMLPIIYRFAASSMRPALSTDQPVRDGLSAAGIGRPLGVMANRTTAQMAAE